MLHLYVKYVLTGHWKPQRLLTVAAFNYISIAVQCKL